MAEVTTAMLYFACGGMDESHNIVLSHRYTQWGQKCYKAAISTWYGIFQIKELKSQSA